MTASRAPRIAVVGSNMVDLVTYVNRMPVKGETIEAPRFEMGHGGKGANQAVAAAKLGVSVMMVTAVGDDIFVEGTIRNLERVGIDTTYLRRVQGLASGVTLDHGRAERRECGHKWLKGTMSEAELARYAPGRGEIRRVPAFICGGAFRGPRVPKWSSRRGFDLGSASRGRGNLYALTVSNCCSVSCGGVAKSASLADGGPGAKDRSGGKLVSSSGAARRRR